MLYMLRRSPSVRSYTFERVVLIIIGVLLIGGVVGIALALAHYKKLQAARWITLPDGSRAEVVGATLGDGPFNSEKPWERFARHHLPAAWTGWIPPAVTNGGWGGLDSNTLTVFLLVKPPSAAGPGTYNWLGVTPKDDSGFCYWGGGARSSYSGPGGSSVYELVFMNYPRRQKEFLLRFADFKGAEIASLRVPNPASGPFPQWQPLPLPQTQTNGPVILTLDRLGESLVGISRMRPDLGGSDYYHEVITHTHVTTADPAWINAQATDIFFSDATGNQGQNMSRREPAWKARILAYHNGPGAFGPDQKLILTNLAIPAPGSYLALNQNMNLAGVGLNVRFLVGAGKLTLGNNGSVTVKPPPAGAGNNYGSGAGVDGSGRWWQEGKPFLLIETTETTNARPDDRLQVFIHYDTVNDLAISERVFSGSAAWNRYQSVVMRQIPFNPPQGAKSFSMTVIINRPLPFEFIINPADIQVSNPPASH